MRASSIALVLWLLASGSCGATTLDGLQLRGEDGAPLGIVSCDSIGNPASVFGSPIGERSIWNVIGKYGSVISDFSAYDPIAQQPPVLVDAAGGVIAYVSANGAKFPRVSPKRLEAFLILRCNRDDGYRR